MGKCSQQNMAITLILLCGSKSQLLISACLSDFNTVLLVNVCTSLSDSKTQLLVNVWTCLIQWGANEEPMRDTMRANYWEANKGQKWEPMRDKSEIKWGANEGHSEDQWVTQVRSNEEPMRDTSEIQRGANEGHKREPKRSQWGTQVRANEEPLRDTSESQWGTQARTNEWHKWGPGPMRSQCGTHERVTVAVRNKRKMTLQYNSFLDPEW